MNPTLGTLYDMHSSDELLRQGCIEKNRLAQELLYKRYHGNFLGIAMRYTNDRSEAIEVLNKAFLKIFNSLEQYRSEGPFAGWMSRIVFHTAIDHVRLRSAYHKNVSFNLENADQPIQSEAISQLENDDLFRLIQKLPEKARTVFSLYVLEGYKHQEIAELLQIEEGTSKWYLSQARNELKHQIHKLNYVNV
jgi:RNA polymerase sigma factor (sigma-70 family)